MARCMAEGPVSGEGFAVDGCEDLVCLALDVVQRRDQFQSLLGQGAAVVGPQLVELAPRVRQAATLGDTGGEQRLVAGVVVAHERALPRILA